MTQNISSAKRNLPYFLREMLTGRIPLLLWSVLLFMLMPVVALGTHINAAAVGNEATSDIIEAVCAVSYFSLFALLGAALVSAVMAYSVFFDRKNAVFRLGFPVKRDTLFWSRVAATALPPLVAYLLNLLLSGLILAARSPVGLGSIYAMLFGQFGNAVVLYLWLYAGALFGASFCARGFCAALMAIWVFAFLPVQYAALRSTVDVGSSSIVFRILTTELVCRDSNPIGWAVRIVSTGNATRGLYRLPVGAALAILGITVLLLVAAMLVTRRRTAESAGESVIFPHFGEFIKFTALVPTGLLFGYFFYLIFETEPFYCFGIVWGVFVGMLIFNLVLYRTGRRLFKNWGKTIVFAVVLFLAAIGILFGSSWCETRTYNSENVASVTLEVGFPHPVTLTGEQAGKFLDSLTDDYAARNSKSRCSYSLVITPKFGFTVERNAWGTSEETAELLRRAVADAYGVDGLTALILPDETQEILRLEIQSIEYSIAPLSENGQPGAKNNMSGVTLLETVAKRRAAEFVEGKTPEFAVGGVSYRVYNEEPDLFFGGNYTYYSLPLYATDSDLLPLETVDEIIARATKISVCRCGKYNDGTTVAYEEDWCVEITDPAKIREALLASGGSTDSDPYGFFRANDGAWEIAVYQGEEYNHFFTTYFRSGCVPAWLR